MQNIAIVFSGSMTSFPRAGFADNGQLLHQTTADLAWTLKNPAHENQAAISRAALAPARRTI
jgi:hypothetical protein